jgi:hypothetical protein
VQFARFLSVLFDTLPVSASFRMCLVTVDLRGNFKNEYASPVRKHENVPF